jgi:hypothetical protein
MEHLRADPRRPGTTLPATSARSERRTEPPSGGPRWPALLRAATVPESGGHEARRFPRAAP